MKHVMFTPHGLWVIMGHVHLTVCLLQSMIVFPLTFSALAWAPDVLSSEEPWHGLSPSPLARRVGPEGRPDTAGSPPDTAGLSPRPPLPTPDDPRHSHRLCTRHGAFDAFGAESTCASCVIPGRTAMQ